MRVYLPNLTAFLCGLLLIPALWLGSFDVAAQSSEVDKLKQEINERSQRLLDIEKEIAQFEADLKKVGAEKKHPPKSHQSARARAQKGTGGYPFY